MSVRLYRIRQAYGAIRYLAVQGRLRQFPDLGSGIPTPPNVHEAVQHAAPENRIVYVDNDPISTVAHRVGQALLRYVCPSGRHGLGQTLLT